MKKTYSLFILLAAMASQLMVSAQNSCYKPVYDKQFRYYSPDNNVIENPSFDVGNYKWEFLPSASRASIVKKGSNNMAKLISLNQSDGDALISQTIPDLTTGYTYTMSAYLKSSGSEESNTNVTLQMRFNYPNGGYEVVPFNFTPTATWEKYSFTFAVPTTANLLMSISQVLLYRGQNDSVFVDSVMVQNANLVQNPAFELGNSKWTLLPNASMATVNGSGNNSSANCIKMTSLQQVDGDALITQTLPRLTAGNTYTMSAYLKASAAVNASITLQTRFNYPNGGEDYRLQTFFPTTSWQKYSFTFTAPTTQGLLVSLAQVSFYRGQNTTIYVDDIEVLNANGGVIYNYVNSSVPKPPLGIFNENFTGTAGSKLSFDKWLVVKKTWGANNNGVVPENLELVPGGGMRFHGHGNTYNGSVYGATTLQGNGKVRVGACIATKDYYASGKYEVVAKLTPGMINAFWTFHYIEDANYQSGGIKNTEIDFEFPASPPGIPNDPGYTGRKDIINDMNLNTWGGLCNGEGVHASLRHQTDTVRLDSAFHKFTIDWHTGGNGITPSVKWYVDDVLVKTETGTNYVGFRAARFWVGVWYASDLWVNGNNSSLMQYDDKYMEVKSVKITPYYEVNDVWENETDPVIGYVTPQYTNYPTFPSGSRIYNPSTNYNTVNLENTVNKANAVSLSINPSNQIIVLNILNSEDEYLKEVSLFNINGQILEKVNFKHAETKASFDLASKYPSGIYFMQGTTSKGQPFVRKFTLFSNQ